MNKEEAQEKAKSIFFTAYGKVVCICHYDCMGVKRRPGILSGSHGCDKCDMDYALEKAIEAAQEFEEK